MLHSIAAVADELFDQLDANSMHALKTMKKSELHSLHHGWGTSIRNKYGLWNPQNPLTKNWHAHPEKHDMSDGIDYSKDHPDAMSMQIIEAVWKKANA